MGKSASIKVDSTSLRRVLENHGDFRTKTVPHLVKQHARLCCVELAARTTPFSVGSLKQSAKLQGEGKVMRDIQKVIKGRDTIDAIADKMTNDRIRNRIHELANSGNSQALSHLFRNMGIFQEFGGVQFISETQLHAAHQRHRNKRTGRTIKLKEPIKINLQGLDKYIKAVQKRVGMTKGGWAECARLLNATQGDGARGIPAWAKRSRGGGSISDQTKNLENPKVMLMNVYPWADRVCPEPEREKSVQIAYDKMMKQMEKALLAAAKDDFKMNQFQVNEAV